MNDKRTHPDPVMIGSLRVEWPVALAPMAGYTDSAMRSLCSELGCGMLFTEVVNAHGIAHGSKRSLHMLETQPCEHPVGAHIYGSDPDAMAAAAAIIEQLGRFDFIDVNCGCPVRKIVARGAGAALIRSPRKIEAIVRRISQAVSLPVTVKTRIGYSSDDINILDVAAAAEQGGAASIAVHARVAANRHSGDVAWDVLARAGESVSIPFFGNGGIQSAADAGRMLDETGVDGILVGRAAVGNPWIFRQIRCHLSGGRIEKPSVDDYRAVIATHLRRLADLKRGEHRYRRADEGAVERAVAMQFRGHLHRYLIGFPGWAKVRCRLNTIESTRDVMDAVLMAL